MNLTNMTDEDLTYNLELMKKEWEQARRRCGLRCSDQAFAIEYFKWRLIGAQNKAFEYRQEIERRKSFEEEVNDRRNDSECHS